MLILSIDQAMGQSGWCLIKTDTPKHRVVRYGIVKTKHNKKDPANVNRVFHIFMTFYDMIDRWKNEDGWHPDYIVLERYFSHNTSGALAVAEVRGALKLLAVMFQTGYAEYVRQSVCKLVTNDGTADKAKVSRFIKRRVICPDGRLTDDEYDAIATGYYAMEKLKDAPIETYSPIPATTGKASRKTGSTIPTVTQAALCSSSKCEGSCDCSRASFASRPSKAGETRNDNKR